MGRWSEQTPETEKKLISTFEYLLKQEEGNAVRSRTSTFFASAKLTSDVARSEKNFWGEKNFRFFQPSNVWKSITSQSRKQKSIKAAKKSRTAGMCNFSRCGSGRRIVPFLWALLNPTAVNGNTGKECYMFVVKWIEPFDEHKNFITISRCAVGWSAFCGWDGLGANFEWPCQSSCAFNSNACFYLAKRVREPAFWWMKNAISLVTRGN